MYVALLMTLYAGIVPLADSSAQSTDIQLSLEQPQHVVSASQPSPADVVYPEPKKPADSVNDVTYPTSFRPTDTDVVYPLLDDVVYPTKPTTVIHALPADAVYPTKPGDGGSTDDVIYP
ncbi:hypothetical protein JOF53_006235 [Crossiella equi]|uniref:Uncharacterized protein n=1 Tax=Crossiella equi TaxID=130796 RepID=A0ABS5ALC2_9PSEU|nr:hypothetical protein [Crossiella equi]MBP2477363.1 hypothetical protein [Crossiella equi]